MKRYRRGEVKVDVVVLLPQELITQILLRLPVKSLLQFKSVCKSWLSLISDPHFTKLHFELAAAPPHRLMFISGWDSPPRVLSIDLNASLNQDSGNAELKLFRPAFNSTFARIGGSCRGFLLLDCLSHLCLWNPSTGVHKRVRCSPMASRKNLFFSMFQGVGYDPSTDDYLVVQLLGRLGSGRNRAEVFSVRASQWKEVEPIDMIFFHRNIKNCKDISGLLLNNSIHWLTYCVKEQLIFPVIFAFDLTERRFMEITLLVDFEDDDIGFCGLMKIGEFLSFSLMLNNSIEIWVMKEYKVQSSWTKTIVVSLDHVRTGIFRPICSTKNGDIVGYESETRLTKFNNKGELKENRSYNISPRHCKTVYEESLLSLPCRRR